MFGVRCTLVALQNVRADRPALSSNARNEPSAIAHDQARQWMADLDMKVEAAVLGAFKKRCQSARARAAAATRARASAAS